MQPHQNWWQRFRFASRGTQVGISCGVLIGACVLCSGGIVALGSVLPPAAQSPATSQPLAQNPTATSQSLAAATATETMPPTATATPKPQATATTAPSGPPQVGGPYANFVAAYGQPFGQGTGGSQNFYADKDQTIILNVSSSGGTVTHVIVLGPSSWSDQQGFAECVLFLPGDATKFNTAGPYTDYHSSIGEVVIDNTGQGTCQVYTANS